MPETTTYDSPNTPITLRDRTRKSLSLQLTELVLSVQEGEISECRLTVEVDFDQYQRIEHEALFHLDPEARNLMGTDFERDLPVEIEARLSSDCLASLASQATNAEAAVAYLLQLSQTQSDSPLLETESWFALYVNQSVPLPPELDLEEATLKEGYSTTWAEEEGAIEAEQEERGEIFRVMVDFFLGHDWSFVPLPEQAVLQLDFQGDSMAWTCFAQAREAQQQCMFYSLCPLEIPADKRLAVAEFLTRANFGLPIGNFEMDLDDGEIRFKTSIDVEGDRLSLELFQRLVVANVTIMDRYLPDIQSILESPS